MTYKLHPLILAGLLTSLNPICNGQITSKIVGTPIACVNTLGEVNVSYIVTHRFTNPSSSPIKVRIATSTDEIFYLFRSTDTTDPGAAIYSHNPDSVTIPPAKAHNIKPNGLFTWTTTATVSIPGPGGGAAGMPTPGDYFLLPYPDFEIVSQTPTEKSPAVTWPFLPLHIDQPPAAIAKCKK